MEEPGWAWPAWKFNMKRHDLFTSLHEQYNTLSFTLQDPEAFHHDVLELSSQADTAEQFHRLMAERKTQRTHEINECLETLAVEIIANPTLVGTDQWEHALQLFRTKSYDSIVRYFASYIPRDFFDTRIEASSFSKFSLSETNSTCTTSTNLTDVDEAASQYFDDDIFDGSVMTVEPCLIGDAQKLHSSHSEAAPLETSDESCHSPADITSHLLPFSGSRSAHLSNFAETLAQVDDDATSQSDSGETALVSMCDSVETISSADSTDDYKNSNSMPTTPEGDDDWNMNDVPIQYIGDEADFAFACDAETPTPRHLSEATNYLEHIGKSTVVKAFSLRPSPSPRMHCKHRISDVASSTVRRRSPEEVLTRIKKPSDTSKKRLRDRIGLDLA